MPPKGESLTTIENSPLNHNDEETVNKNCPSFDENNPSDLNVKSYENNTSLHNNTPELTISTNNSFHTGYFYPTQLSPIYEPDTESVCSSNHSSPLHLPLTNGFSTNQYSLYNNNNKYIEDIVKVPPDSSSQEHGFDNSEAKENNLCSDNRKSGNTNGLITKNEVKSKFAYEDTIIEPNNSDSIKGSSDDKTQKSSMSFKSVLSAIQFSSSQKLTKLRGFQFSNSSESSTSSSICPPIITINNDAIISNPLKSRLMNQFKSTNTSKTASEEAKEGEAYFMINRVQYSYFMIHLAFFALACH